VHPTSKQSASFKLQFKKPWQVCIWGRTFKCYQRLKPSRLFHTLTRIRWQHGEQKINYGCWTWLIYFGQWRTLFQASGRAVRASAIYIRAHQTLTCAHYQYNIMKPITRSYFAHVQALTRGPSVPTQRKEWLTAVSRAIVRSRRDCFSEFDADPDRTELSWWCSGV